MNITSFFLLLLSLLLFISCSPDDDTTLLNPNPYNPEIKMAALKERSGANVSKMHFLVFGDSKGSKHFPAVLKRADSLKPDFCITTADLVNVGGGRVGKRDYATLDRMGGWFMKKYAMWPTVGNHEVGGGSDAIKNFTNFFGMKEVMYSFEYGNAKFIALPWPKIKDAPKRLEWLEKELKSAKGKHIFIYKHRPHYTLGNKAYTDVEGQESATTKLYDKYKVLAVFSGHDHIYYRTKRKNTNYIISAGAGAPIYALLRERDAIKGDVYYGAIAKKVARHKTQFKFHHADDSETLIKNPMFYVLSVKIDGQKVSIEMIDEKTGKVWDKAVISK